MNELRKRALGLEPCIRIGKAGLSEGVIEEIMHQLKKKKLIKVKLLRSSLDELKKDDLRDEIVRRCDAELVSHVGFVITLYKK
jgi:RNA-binding protein